MNGWYLAAKIAIAGGACLAALWAPGSLGLSIYADDTKNWWPVFVGGLLCIVLCIGSLAMALAALGWVFE